MSALTAAILFYSPYSFAEEWGLCSIPVIEKRTVSNNALEQPIFMSADELNTPNKSLLQLTGKALLKQAPDTVIESEELFFDRDNESVISKLPSIFKSDTSILSSKSLRFNSKTDSGTFNGISLQSLDTHRFITADKLVQKNDHEQQFERFSFSTCEPNDKAWELRSSSLALNHETGLGVTKDAKIYLFGVPIFYFPYFQFPIDDNRHSGILMPSFALSSSKGNEINLPIYWNIHPQLDSTIELNINSLRGLQINTETRFLNERTTGILSTSSLNDDEENTKRYFYRLEQQAKIANINIDLVAQNVSDEDFLSDFGITNLSNKNDYLERHLTFKHAEGNWSSTVLYQNYQILDDTKSITSRPYEQWPKITSIGQFSLFNNTSTLILEQSYVNFKRDDSINGKRYIFNPSISRTWANSYSFLTPTLSYSLSKYDLSNTNTGDQQVSRSLPTLSIDSGLFFERIANDAGDLLQTFEPRLFYLRTPFEEQSDIPDFDSSNLSLNYANLFKRNRFNGGDRIGDAHQLTLGLSTSFLDINSGRELFRASLGQTYHLRDRQVQLSGSSVASENTSDLFLEIASNPIPYWNITSSISKQAETGFLSKKNIKVSRQHDGHILNLSYRFQGTENSTTLEQSDISVVYPINNQWKLFAKKQYSIIDHQNVEQLIGTSYDSCCWTFSITIQETSDDQFEEFDRSIFFQFTLKGLSSIGRKNKELLSKSIPGFY